MIFSAKKYFSPENDFSVFCLAQKLFLFGQKIFFAQKWFNFLTALKTFREVFLFVYFFEDLKKIENINF